MAAEPNPSAVLLCKSGHAGKMANNSKRQKSDDQCGYIVSSVTYKATVYIVLSQTVYSSHLQ